METENVRSGTLNTMCDQRNEKRQAARIQELEDELTRARNIISEMADQLAATRLESTPLV